MDECVAVPLIPGTGKFLVDVAGESFYEESFAVLCGARTIEGVRLEVRALLVLEDDNPHDKHAVRVTIDGNHVGYLSRDDARAFRRQVRYGVLSVHEVFECAGIICGGWDRGEAISATSA